MNIARRSGFSEEFSVEIWGVEGESSGRVPPKSPLAEAPRSKNKSSAGTGWHWWHWWHGLALVAPAGIGGIGGMGWHGLAGGSQLSGFAVVVCGVAFAPYSAYQIQINDI